MNKYTCEHWLAIHSRIEDLEKKVHGMSATGSFSGQNVTAAPTLTELQSKIHNLQQQIADLHLTHQSAETELHVGLFAGEIGAVGGTNLTPDINKKIKHLEEKMALFEGIFTVLNREIENLSEQGDKAEAVRQSEREFYETMNSKITVLERQHAMKDASIAELTHRMTVQEQTSYDSTLMWKITDISQKRQDAISGKAPSIYSPPFYTSKTGGICI